MSAAPTEVAKGLEVSDDEDRPPPREPTQRNGWFRLRHGGEPGRVVNPTIPPRHRWLSLLAWQLVLLWALSWFLPQVQQGQTLCPNRWGGRFSPRALLTSDRHG